MSIITFTSVYGRINLATEMASLASLTVKPPFVTDSATNTGRMIPGERKVPQQSTMDAEGGGGWTTQKIGQEEGTIILLKGKRTLNGRPRYDGYLFLRLRASAPVVQVKLRLPTSPRSLLGGSIVAFVGHADVIGIDELKSMDIEIGRNRQSAYMDPEEVADLFTVTELVPGTKPAPQLARVATADGVKLVAMAAEPVRRVRLRRS